MAVINILSHSEQGDTTLSGTANTAQEYRVHVADRVSIYSSSALELWYDEDDGDSVSAGEGLAIPADTWWTIPVDRRRVILDGYFKFALSSATTSATVDWVAESGSAA